MRVVGWFLGAVVALVLILFAVSNRTPVDLRIEPLPFVVELPLYGAVFAALVLGFVIGGLLAWLSGGKWRRRARKAAAETARLRQELSAAQSRTHVNKAGQPEGTQPLPPAG